MKKIIATISILTLLSFPSTLIAHTEEDPLEIDLMAGQHTDVGEVEVWNDSDNLYVKYVVKEEGWCLTETHLHVADSVENIPQKNGNPIPGKFDYKMEHDCVIEYIYPAIQLNSWLPGTPLNIAAHAVIEKVEVETMSIEPDIDWQRSAETEGVGVLSFSGFGGAWTPAEGFGIPLDPVQVVWDNGTYYLPSGVPVGTNWASWKYMSTEPDGGSYNGNSDLRRFHAAFTIPSDCQVISGNLRSASGFDGIPINDNVYIFLNEDLLFWGGTRANVLPQFEGMTGVQALRGATNPKETDRWYISGTLPTVTSFINGTNYIDIFTEENERWGGFGELALDLTCEITHVYNETAWGEGTDFPGKSWAMYFTYTVQETEPVFIDTIEVPSDGSSVSSIALEEGVDYLIMAEGTYTYWPVQLPSAGIADAKYSLRPEGSYNPGPGPQWISGDDLPSPWTNYLEVLVNGSPVSWGTYNAGHEYSINYPGDGSSVSFQILDSHYGDNSGSIIVEIYEI